MHFNTFPRWEKSFSYSTDTSFLRKVKSGDEYAWQKFYRRYAGMIHRIGKNRQLTPKECEELMSDVMVIFWKKLATFTYDPERGKFRSFLAKISHYSAIKIFNRREKNEIIPLEEAEYPGEIDRKYMQEWQDFVLNWAMEELKNQVDTDSYQVFYMLFIQKRPISQICAITRKNRNNIYVIRSRCTQKLKALIRDYRNCAESKFSSHSQSSKCEN